MEGLTLFILVIVHLLNQANMFVPTPVLREVITFFNVEIYQLVWFHSVYHQSSILFGPIFCYLGDRYSRKFVLTFVVLLWSIATFCCSFVPYNLFGWFIALRMLAAGGEIGFYVIAPSIIADIYVDNARSKALTLFYFVVPFGA